MNRLIFILRAALLAAVALVGLTAAAAPSGAPVAGVSLELARHRASTISQLRYELALSIPAATAEPVTGSNLLRFRLSDASQPLVIDFDPDAPAPVSMSANGVAVAAEVASGHLVVAAKHLRRGENTVRIGFRAGNAPLNRSPDLLYSLFVPARARAAIPCFDQPDLKGRWSVTLEHPAAWLSVANGAERERRQLGDRSRVRFAQTEPLPTYLVAFAAGRMKVETARRDGRMMRMFHRESDAAKLARNRDALFDLHAQSLAFLERYTGIPYAFGKFDFVLIPAFQFSGMEHAGAIAYNAEELLLDESATQDDLLGRARLIAHEAAHLWFGDLVTMRWFDDVWTKEVFANFMASKIADPLFPQVRHDLQFFLDHHGGAYAVDRSAGANPIRQPLANLADAGSLYGPIVYQKSPVVMRQLEALLGEAAFRDGLRDYLRRHAFANATWDDLIAALAPHTRLDLRQWSRVWIDEPGRPRIQTTLSSQAGRVERLALRQSDPQGRGRLWPQQLRATVGCRAQTRRIVAEMTLAEVDLTSMLGDCVPQYVLAGGEGWGYAEFELDSASLDFLGRSLHTLDDPLARGVAWSALWEAMLSGSLAPQRLYDTAMAGLQQERNEQLIGEWLTDLRTLWWRFLSPAQRQEREAALETLLRTRMDQAASPGLKSSWFAALRAVAGTPETVAWLRALWQREAQIAGLPLVEADETALATALALRGVEGAAAILDQQAQRIDNPDRRARLQFVRGALSADPAVREAWFRSLADPANRRRETWVQEGMRLLHHPLRAPTSAPLVQPALAMLRDVQASGALFFDANWLSALLSGHASPEVAATVQQFVAQLPPEYPPRLRALVLQSSDTLMRAARVQAR